MFAILLASVCLGLLVNFVDPMYLLQASNEGRLNPGLSEIEVATLKWHRLSNIFVVFSWNIEFAIKFSYLLFFKVLIHRIHAMEVYWRYVVTVTTITWLGGTVGVLASCPYYDDRALQCANDNTTKSTVFYAVLAGLDASTDLAIMSIPIFVLRKVQLKQRRKFLLGLFMCLSVVMIGVVITKSAGIHVPGQRTIDIVWQVYWQFMECCLAIIMACLTAFRSIYVQHVRNQSSSRRSWYPGIKVLLTAKSARKSPNIELPPIPRATLTGMRTFIEGDRRESLHDCRNLQNQDEDEWPLQASSNGKRIKVRHEFSSHWDPASSIIEDHESFV